MIIDAHNHADWHGHNFERFIANMDKFGIDKTWILSWECPDDEFDPNSIWAFPLPMAHSEHIGENADHPELCPRCAGVVAAEAVEAE